MSIRARYTTNLKQLVGNYIDRSDSGYHLRPEGIRLSLILRAGTLDLQQSDVRLEPDFECHISQSPVVGRFSYGCIEVLCKECGFWYDHGFLYLSPAAFTDESGSFSFSQFTEYLIQVTFSIGQDICFSCSHSLDSTVKTEVDRFQCDHTVLVNKSCDQCGASWVVPLGRALLSDPGLVAFCYDHEIDVLSTPYWELEFAGIAEHVTVCSTDPWEVALDVTIEGDTPELVVDRDATVIERTRTDDSDDEHR